MAGTESLPRYQLMLFGQSSLRMAGAELPITRRKFLAVLAYLSLTHGHSASRRRLGTLLWPDSEPEQSLSALRQTFKDVRNRFPTAFDDVADVSRIGVRLRTENVRSDYAAMLETLGQGRVPTEMLSVPSLPDTFLQGFDDLGRAFSEWVAARRVEVRNELLLRLHALADGSVAPLATRRQIGTAIRNIDKANELGCRLLMQSHAEEGNLAEAMLAYSQMEDAFRSRYGILPSEETRALMDDLRSGGRPSFIQSGPDPSPTLTVHLSEFITTSLPTDQAAFIEAFRQDLTVSLLRFRQWNVVQVKGSDTPRDGYVLGCMAMADDDDVILMLTVRDAASGRVVWGETYRADVLRWYKSQRRIIRTVATALHMSVIEARLSCVAGLADMEAPIHDRWLRGMALRMDWSPQSDLRAERIFRSIIAERPDHAGAMSCLARTIASRPHVFPGTRLARARREEALSLARHAVALDPADALSHLALGWALAVSGHSLQASASFRAAADMNPFDVVTTVSSALGLSLCGQTEAAGRIADGIVEDATPLTRTNQAHLGIVRLLKGDLEGGMENILLAGDAVPSALGCQAAVLASKGRMLDASETADLFRSAVRRRWFGEREPTDGVIGEWVLTALPMGDAGPAHTISRGLHLMGFLSDERDIAASG